jgi:hypothetical protein
VTDGGSAPVRDGRVLLGNWLLVALGVAATALHASLMLGDGPPFHPSRAGLEFLALGFYDAMTAMVIVALLVAGLSRGVVPTTLRRIELALSAALATEVVVEVVAAIR